MCLCNGTGGIQIGHSWGLEFKPCPDTDCQFDKDRADREYQAFLQRLAEFEDSSEAV